MCKIMSFHVTDKNFTGNYVLFTLPTKKTAPILCPFKAFPRVTLLSQSHITDKTAGSIVFSRHRCWNRYRNWDVPHLSVLITAIGVWSTATPGATSSGKLLESTDLNQCKSDDRIQSLTWFLHLSLRYSYNLSSMLTDKGVRGRDKLKRELDSFPLNDQTVFIIQSPLDGLPLDDMMMISNQERAPCQYSRRQTKSTSGISRQPMNFLAIWFQILVPLGEMCWKTHLRSFSHDLFRSAIFLTQINDILGT